MKKLVTICSGLMRMCPVQLADHINKPELISWWYLISLAASMGLGWGEGLFSISVLLE